MLPTSGILSCTSSCCTRRSNRTWICKERKVDDTVGSCCVLSYRLVPQENRWIDRVCGISCIILSCTTLYFLIFVQKQLNEIERKVGSLEESLNKNRDTMSQLKDTLKVISNNDYHHNPKVVAPQRGKENNEGGDTWLFHQRPDGEEVGAKDDVAQLSNLGAKAHVNQMECSFAAGESGTSVDVQVM